MGTLDRAEYLELHQPQFSKNARDRKRKSAHDLGVEQELVPKLHQIQQKKRPPHGFRLFNFRSVAGSSAAECQTPTSITAILESGESVTTINSPQTGESPVPFPEMLSGFLQLAR